MLHIIGEEIKKQLLSPIRRFIGGRQMASIPWMLTKDIGFRHSHIWLCAILVVEAGGNIFFNYGIESEGVLNTNLPIEHNFCDASTKGVFKR